MKRSMTVMAAALAALLAAPPVLADVVAVPYQDLDLNTAEGQQTLDGSIDAAAKKVCGFDDVRTGSRMISQDSRNCYNQARQELKKRIAALTEQKAAGG